jgi:hypothetical protein
VLRPRNIVKNISQYGDVLTIRHSREADCVVIDKTTLTAVLSFRA